MVCSSAPHSQAAEGAISHLYKQEWKLPTLVRRQLSWTHAVLGRVIPRVWAGPAFSRLDWLLAIEPRAKEGPAQRLQTYTLNRKCLWSAGAGPTLFFKRRKIKLTALFYAINHHNSFLNRNNGHCFPAMCSLSFFNSRREDNVLKLFSVSITSVSFFAGQFSKVTTRYGSIVIAVSKVTATCLLNV